MLTLFRVLLSDRLISRRSFLNVQISNCNWFRLSQTVCFLVLLGELDLLLHAYTPVTQARYCMLIRRLGFLASLGSCLAASCYFSSLITSSLWQRLLYSLIELLLFWHIIPLLSFLLVTDRNDMRELRADLLHKLEKLEILHLSYNELTSLPDGMFHHNPGLRMLRIRGNDIAELSQDVFQYLPNLEVSGVIWRNTPPQHSLAWNLHNHCVYLH